MALPIDPGKIKKAADKIQKNIDVDVHINIYYDLLTNVEMLSSFRDYLNEADDSVIINYHDLSNKNLHIENNPDFAIIFSGDAKNTVYAYDALQTNDIPTLIIAIDPSDIVDASDNLLISIRKTDFICPKYSTYNWVGDKNTDGYIDFNIYNKNMDASLKEKMIYWLYTYSEDVQIAYAAKFPYLRPFISTRVINAASIENAGVGAIKIIPGADMPIMTLNQARMILELAAMYGYEINTDRIVEIIALILSAFGFKYLSKYINEATKIPDSIVDAIFGFAGTQLLGYVAREYFSSGLAPEGLVDTIKSLFK